MERGNFDGKGRPIVKYMEITSMCGGDAAFLSNYVDHLLVLLRTLVILVWPRLIE